MIEDQRTDRDRDDAEHTIESEPRVPERHTDREQALPRRDPVTERRPVPGVKHEPEPDAGNIMPAEDEPGTL